MQMPAMDMSQEQYYAQAMGGVMQANPGMHPVQQQQQQMPAITHSNVFVRNIPPEVDENALQQMFATYGYIEHTRLVKNKNPHSNNYGFVKFQSIPCAQLAISSMNNAQVGNVYLEVKFATQDLKETGGGVSVIYADGSYQGTPSQNLYVRNLPASYQESDLNTLFSLYGTVQEAKLLHVGDPSRQGSALIKMSSQDEAKRAIESLHGKPPVGGAQSLILRYADTEEEKARKRSNTAQNQQAPNGTARYAPYALTPQQPQQVPQAVPQAYPGQMSYDPQQGAYGYPQAAPQPAPAAGVPQYPGAPAAAPQVPMPGYEQYYQTQQNPALQGQGYAMPSPVAAQPGMPQPAPVAQPQQQTGSTSVYVKNIPCTEKDECELFLYRKFAPIGAIVSIFVMTDKETGKAKGVGFVNYNDPNSAQTAIQQLNGLKVEDKILGVALQNSRKKQ